MDIEPSSPKRIVRRVLVVDDDANDREAARLWMPDQEVLVEADDTKVLARVRAEQPCLVILDAWLDGKASGFDLAKVLKAENANLPVVVISAGLTARAAALIARRNPADLLLPKQGRRTFEEILAFIECDIEPDPWDDETAGPTRREFALRLLARCGGNKAEAARRANVSWSTMHRWLEVDADSNGGGNPHHSSSEELSESPP